MTSPQDAFYLGWTETLEKLYQGIAQEDTIPGRVAVSHGYLGTAWTPEGEIHYSVAGRLRLDKNENIYGQPAVGDWIVLRKSNSPSQRAMVISIMPRASTFSRKIAGNTHKTQVIATNVDTIFITSSMNREFNPRRLERYLALVTESKAQPVFILTKSDCVEDDLPYYIEETQNINDSVPLHTVSPLTGHNMDKLMPYLQKGKTIALVGSSGVGKSTLINYWLGSEKIRTGEIRETDDRGRHTTTHREMFCLPTGTIVIDTPGMRELQLLDKSESLLDSFDDIKLLSVNCKFKDCRHKSEPECAVLKAIDEENLDPDRLDSFHQLSDEISAVKTKGVLKVTTGLKKNNAFSRTKETGKKKN